MGQESTSVSDALRALRARHWAQAAAFGPERYLVATAGDLGVWTSRIIAGLDRVTDDDAWFFRVREEGIARASWELDVHPPDEEPIPERYFHSRSEAYGARCARAAEGAYFSVLYGCLVPRGVEDLLAAGRIVSSELLAQGSLRIQQTCMATGEAAGVAAALSVQAGVTPRELDPQQVVAQLARDRDVEPAFEMLQSPARE